MHQWVQQGWGACWRCVLRAAPWICMCVCCSPLPPPPPPIRRHQSPVCYMAQLRIFHVTSGFCIALVAQNVVVYCVPLVSGRPWHDTGNETSAVTDKVRSSTGRCLQGLEFSVLIPYSTVCVHVCMWAFVCVCMCVCVCLCVCVHACQISMRRLIDWLIDWLNDWLIYWFNDWFGMA